MNVLKDAWLSTIFEEPVFRIDVSLDENVSTISSQIKERILHTVRGFYWVKIDSIYVETVKALSAQGFYVVDTQITFDRSNNVYNRASLSSKIVVDKIKDEHICEVLAIAASCFKYSRFHLDPLISQKIANRVMHDWTLNCISKKRGDDVYVALNDNVPVGFLTSQRVEAGDGFVGILDLIGVSCAYQGKGIGARLVKRFIEDYGKTCNILRVGTQGANIPALQLYNKMKFSIVKTQYVLHKHVNG